MINLMHLIDKLYYTQWAQGRLEDVLWTSILDEGTSQSDVPWTGKMYSITSVPNGRLRTSKLDLVWTSTGHPMDLKGRPQDVQETS